MQATELKAYPAWTEAMLRMRDAGLELPETLTTPKRNGPLSLHNHIPDNFAKVPLDDLHAYYYAWEHRVPPCMSVEEHRGQVLRECTRGQHAKKSPDYWIRQQPPMVVLLRGAPGTGKSTWATQYRAQWPEETVVISATDYFRDANGVVHWCEEDARKSHNWCFTVMYWLCERATPRIVIDNIHTRSCDTETYYFGAIGRAYRVFQKICTGMFANTSGVSEERATAMRERFEDTDLMPHYEQETKDGSGLLS